MQSVKQAVLVLRAQMDRLEVEETLELLGRPERPHLFQVQQDRCLRFQVPREPLKVGILDRPVLLGNKASRAIEDRLGREDTPFLVDRLGRLVVDRLDQLAMLAGTDRMATTAKTVRTARMEKMARTDRLVQQASVAVAARQVNVVVMAQQASVVAVGRQDLLAKMVKMAKMAKMVLMDSVVQTESMDFLAWTE